MPDPRRPRARDLSYATSVPSPRGRVIVRALENATGRLRLMRLAQGYDDEVAAGGDFWEVICNRYGITLDVVGGSLEAIPAHGPLVVVANHPYGILDGLMMGRILSARRNREFKVLAHRIFRRAEDLERVILPISFDETKEAQKLNLDTRAEALAYLRAGGAIGVFPGGTVSTGQGPFGRPLDPGWRTFTAKMIQKSGATVVPIFFEGGNSRLFQIASHLHVNLRMGLLMREFRARIGRPVRVVVGAPLGPEALEIHAKDPRALMDFLRKATYQLSPTPMDVSALGYEFEEKHRGQHGGRNLR